MVEEIRDLTRRFIPMVPKYTNSDDRWTPVASTEKGILLNVQKTNSQVLINADVFRDDLQAENVTKYMENHKIPLHDNFYRRDDYHIFAVKKTYMDTKFKEKNHEDYMAWLKAYLETLTPSQVGQGESTETISSPQLKIERATENSVYFPFESHNRLCEFKFVVDNEGYYRAHKFICNSENANCAWFIAEHCNPWYQDGTLICVVKRALWKGNPMKKNFKPTETFFMYLETPLLFTRLDNQQSSEQCNRPHIYEDQVVSRNERDYVTITRYLLNAFNEIHKFRFGHEWQHYQRYNCHFKDFVLFFCVNRTQLLQFEATEKELYSIFWGNVWLNYDERPVQSQVILDGIANEIFWPDQRRAPSPIRSPSPQIQQQEQANFQKENI